MLSRAIPYEGQEPYIFFSYCHKDEAQVHPLLEQMARDGYRVWHDEGNQPGVDWVENIAAHLNDSAIFLAMISENSADSHNCKNEMNFAVELNKKMAAVVLEEFQMTLGMRMQLASTHYLKRTEYPSNQMLLQKIYETDGIAACRAAGSMPMREIAVETAAKDEKPVFKTPGLTDLGPSINVAQPNAEEVPEIASKPVTEDAPEVQPEPVAKAAPEVQPEPVAKAAPEEKEASPAESSKPAVDRKPEEEEDERTVQVLPVEPEEDAPTQQMKHRGRAILLRLSRGKAYWVDNVLTRLGRSERKCDLVLRGNPSISNSHAELVEYKGQYYLRDKGSANGTFVGEQRLTQEDKIQLECGNVFRLYDEEFALIFGEQVAGAVTGNSVYYLRSESTGNVRAIFEKETWLDRHHKWPDGTLLSAQVSRSQKHARIVREDGLWLEDVGSTNGTYMGQEKDSIACHTPFRLSDGSKFRLGGFVLQVGVATFEGE